MEARRRCILEQWPKRPSYNINLYRSHYFYFDIDDLLKRFTEEHEEMKRKRRKLFGKKDIEKPLLEHDEVKVTDAD